MANAALRIRRTINKKKPGRRSTADKVQAQGTGRAVTKAFGGGKAQPPSIPRLPGACWDAFNSAHAALPRAVGPYTVVRTSRLINTSARFCIVGTFAANATTANDNRKCWTNLCALTYAGAGSIGGSPATKFYGVQPPVAASISQPAGGGTLCPSAISVQILGVDSLQNANGQLAAAVCPVRLDLKGTDRSWANIESTFMSYMRPRLMSAGKLVLRGVQMDSHPLSMSDVSDFRGMSENTVAINEGGTAAAPWNEVSNDYDPEGWAPMVVFNPAETPLSLLVTIEWRVRFDLSNPAVSSHTHHGVSSDVAWEKHISAATRQLPGVIDIVEKVASTGFNVMSMMRGA